MTERGFIAIARGMLDHPVVGASKPYSIFEAWFWLLEQAVWKSRRVRVTNGRSMAVVTLERGQLTYSRSFLAVAWGWSEKRVRTFLNRLEREGQIDLQKGQPQMLVTICKYDGYQLGSPNGGRQTGRQRANDGPEEEEGNKGRKEIMRRLPAEAEGFAEWYDLYPRKKARKDAIRAYAKVVPTEISSEDLIERTKQFAAQWTKRPKADLQFCPYPASWLNAGEFLDVEPDRSVNGGEGTNIQPPTRNANEFTEAEWLDRLAMHRRGEGWTERHWGPAPGQPGCLVPAKLLMSAAPVEGGSDAPPARAGISRAGNP
jgi:hypothetical protein